MLRADSHLYGTEREPLWSLLYRYWFWGWLFQDVNEGDVLRRAASWRHNIAMRACLPTYMGRWLVCSAATVWAGQGAEAATGAPVVSAFFYTWAVLALVVFVVALTVWTFLARPAPR